MKEQRFKTTLSPAGEGGAWTGIFLTQEQSSGLGKRGRVAVSLTINGHPFKAFAAPIGDGTHGIVVNKQMQKKAAVAPLQEVDITLAVDMEPRSVAVPAELAARLRDSPRAATFFEELAYTHKKDFVTWITGAKREETRERRLDETIRLMETGIKWKDK